jgi:bifunctional pyridoxal-dependent enzyme with beta-cystathionase and maltose regulon repressor activities
MNKKIEKREKGRELKALKAADIDRSIERELLERLKQVTDNEIYNYPERQYSKVLDKASDKYKQCKYHLLKMMMMIISMMIITRYTQRPTKPKILMKLQKMKKKKRRRRRN